MAARKKYEGNAAESHRQAVAEYQKKNERMSLIFPPGTKERIEALHLDKTAGAFVRDTVLAELDRLEKILK